MVTKIEGSGTISAGTYGHIIAEGSVRADGTIHCEELRAAGASRFAGSVYCGGELHGEGSCRVEQDVEAGVLSTEGACHIRGSLKAGEVRTEGSCSVGRDVTAQALHADGAFRADGSVRAEECNTDGSLKVGGDLKGRELRLSGGVTVNGEIEAEELEIDGKVNCAGLMNAEHIVLRYQGNCTVGSIGGSSICIEPAGENLFLLRLGSAVLGRQTLRSFTVADSIEGDEIRIEGVKAASVVGRIVYIGPGCQIGRVIYSQSADVDSSATVGSVEESAV